MLIQRLKLENFLVYADVDLDMRDVKLASIIGTFVSDSRRSNGAGKSALIEAVRYGLFDTSRSKSKNGIVRNGSDKCVVEIEVHTGRNHLRVRRVRSSSGTSTATLHVDGKPSCDKITEVNSSIVSYLGIDSDLFDLIYFFKQNDQFGFADAKPSDRKSALAKVFRMDDLAACKSMVADRLRIAREAVQRSKGAAEAAASRLSSMWSMQELADRVSAAEANLAWSRQLRAECHTLMQDMGVESDRYAQMAQEWRDGIKDDKASAKKATDTLNTVNSQIASLQSEFQKGNSQCNSINALIDQLTNQLGEAPQEEIEYLQKSVNKISKNLSKARTDASTANAMRNQILSKVVSSDTAGADCPTCGQFVTTDHVECVNKARTQEANKFKMQASMSQQMADKLSDELEEATRKLEHAKSYKHKLATIDAYRESHKQARSNVRRIERDLKKAKEQQGLLTAEVQKRIKNLDQDVIGSYESLVQYYLNAHRSMSSYRAARVAEVNDQESACNAALSDAQSKYRERVSAESDAKKADELLKDAQREERVLSALSEAFGKNGIQALVIENAVGVIEQFANEILTSMHTRFAVQLRTQKQIKSGEERESLDIIVFDNGSERAFESYSGGERTMINLALRLSLSKVISSLHGVRMRSLFLDEVLGALDEVNREEVVKVLAFLSRSFDQVLVISHTDEIKSLVDTGIVIERHQDHSVVRLTHGRTE